MFLNAPGPVVFPVVLGVMSLTVGLVGLVWNAINGRRLGD